MSDKFTRAERIRNLRESVMSEDAERLIYEWVKAGTIDLAEFRSLLMDLSYVEPN